MNRKTMPIAKKAAKECYDFLVDEEDLGPVRINRVKHFTAIIDRHFAPILDAADRMARELSEVWSRAHLGEPDQEHQAVTAYRELRGQGR